MEPDDNILSNIIDLDREDQLRHGALQCDTELVLSLLNHNVNVNASDDDGRTALYMATDEGHQSMVEILLEAGANVNITCGSGNTVLHLAAQRGHLHICEILLTTDAIINAVNSYGRTALHEAVDKNNFYIAMLLLDLEANINAEDACGRTALHLAAATGFNCMVESLIHRDANVNQVDADGNTVLHIAAEMGNFHLVEYLLTERVDVNAANNNGKIALELALQSDQKDVVQLFELCMTTDKSIYQTCIKGNVALLKWLFTHGENIDQMNTSCCQLDKYKRTALHLATQMENASMVNLLIAWGAESHAADSEGITPLDQAKKCGNKSLVECMQQPTIHCAVRNNHIDALTYTLDHGSDVNIRDQFGQTALHIAVWQNNLEAVRILMRNSADPHAQDLHGRTPIDIATEAKAGDILKELGAEDTPLHSTLSLDSDLVGQYNNDKNILQSKVWTLQGLMNHPDIGSLQQTEQSREIDGEVFKLMTNMTRLLKREWEHGQNDTVKPERVDFISVGSSKEKTKIQKPDEYDFLVALDLPCLEAEEHICGLPLCPTGYGYLHMANAFHISSRDLSAAGLFQGKGAAISSVNFHEWFWTQLDPILRHEEELLQNVEHIVLKYRANHGFLDSKACSTFTLTWTGDTYNGMDIEVDITPSFRFNVKCTFLSPKGPQPDHFFMVPKPPHENSILGMGYEDDERKSFWKVDFVDQECEMIIHMPSVLREAFATCKCVRALIPNLKVHKNDSKHVVAANKIISSYMMKLMFMKMDSRFHDESMAQLVINAFDQLTSYLKDEHLPDYWAFRKPLTEWLEEVETEDLSYYGHSNVLASSKQTINDCHRVASLLRFVTPQLVTYESVIGNAIQCQGTCVYATLRVYDACATGNLHYAELLLESGANFCLPDKDGMTTIHHASAGGHVEMVTWLSEQGVDTSALDKHERTAIHHACAGGHVSVLTWLVESGVSGVLLDKDGCNLIHYASAGGHLNMLKWLCNTGRPLLNWDLNCCDYNGQTALHHACGGGHVKVMEWLVNNGANNLQEIKTLIDGKVDFQNVLIRMIEEGQVDFVKTVVTAGADISTPRVRKALDSAAERKDFYMVKALLGGGDKQAELYIMMSCNPDLQELKWAASVKNVQRVRFLLHKVYEQPVILAAAEEGNVDMIKTLLEARARYKRELATGELATGELATGELATDELAIAAEQGNITMVKTLIQAGANYDEILTRAVCGGNISMVSTLMEGGAEGSIVIEALHTAVGNNQLDMVKALLGVGDHQATLYVMIQMGADKLEKLLEASFEGQVNEVRDLFNQGVNGQAVILAAAEAENETMVKTMIDAGAAYKRELASAAQERKVNIVQTFIKAGAHYDDILLSAIVHKNYDIVQTFLDAGVDSQVVEEIGINNINNSLNLVTI